jgi:hypothetical protein
VVPVRPLSFLGAPSFLELAKRVYRVLQVSVRSSSQESEPLLCPHRWIWECWVDLEAVVDSVRLVLALS